MSLTPRLRERFRSRVDLNGYRSDNHGPHRDLSGPKMDLHTSRGDLHGSKRDLTGSRRDLDQPRHNLSTSRANLHGSQRNIAGSNRDLLRYDDKIHYRPTKKYAETPSHESRSLYPLRKHTSTKQLYRDYEPFHASTTSLAPPKFTPKNRLSDIKENRMASSCDNMNNAKWKKRPVFGKRRPLNVNGQTTSMINLNEHKPRKVRWKEGRSPRTNFVFYFYNFFEKFFENFF